MSGSEVWWMSLGPPTPIPLSNAMHLVVVQRTRPEGSTRGSTGAAASLARMRRVSRSPDDVLAALPDDVRPDMVRLDALISEALPGRSRVVWEGVFWGGTEQQIIGYGDLLQPPARGEAVEWFVAGLARQQKAISVYVNAVDDGRYLLSAYAGRLGRARTGSASLSFKRPEDLDLEAFTELVRRAGELCPPSPG